MSLFIGSILILESPPDLKFWMRVMSWYMPDEQRNPIQEYQVAHIIPGALFFDLDGISDRTTSVRITIFSFY
ncbi:hypothetical protein F2Q69_00021095 [Brassica cretica]|uniref:Uncharacterized protein n=1 Tax=Brassica cretica TaxID=69181 RepID=A0A8S9QUX5_BRACR|nr:hypothetical protein F2Q69_00021095 [Brassica cretica]